MRFKLEYGRTGLVVDLPEKHLVRSLAYKNAPAVPNAEAAIRQAIERPIGSKPLAELARGRRDACVVICDVTRPVPNKLILPQILGTLEGSGIPREKITILVATGLHRPNVGDELVEMVGREIVESYRIKNHHGKELSEHTYLGESPRGVPIWIDSH